jgi:hypothetical protein
MQCLLTVMVDGRVEDERFLHITCTCIFWLCAICASRTSLTPAVLPDIYPDAGSAGARVFRLMSERARGGFDSLEDFMRE